MLEYIYLWMKKLACYLVLIVAIMQMIPGEHYKKYILFFAGMILILMLTEPISKIFGLSKMQNDTFQKESARIEEILNSWEVQLKEEGLDGQ